MKKYISIISIFILSAIAIPVLAATTATNFKNLIEDTIINGILRPLVPLLVSLAVIVFIYGVLTLMFSEGEKREEGKQFMIWGIVGIFVMVSVWGLVAVLRGTFNLPDAPKSIKIVPPTIIK